MNIIVDYWADKLLYESSKPEQLDFWHKVDNPEKYKRNELQYKWKYKNKMSLKNIRDKFEK